MNFCIKVFLLSFLSGIYAQIALPTFQGVHKPQSSSSSYSFTSHTFTNCGQTGRDGPSLATCKSSYSPSWTDDTDYFNVTGDYNGIQMWTVPATGTYRIDAYGAQGASGDGSYVGGKGARMRGDFALTQGEIIRIAVGQKGLGQSSGRNGGGGGASWVIQSPYTDTTAILVIAGGGSGTRTQVSQNGTDAVTGLDARIGSGSSMTNSGALLSTAYRGQGPPISANSWGSSGGGFTSDGAADYGDGGGNGWNNDLEGGYYNSHSYDGGFGGGGSGQGRYGGGGGGGYSGGQGGRVAGGGASYNNGSNKNNEAGNREEHGQVIITKL